MKSLLETFMNNYNHARNHEPIKGHPLFGIMKDLEDEIKELSSVKDCKYLIVKGSIGQGNWATIPWLAIMDKRITTSTQKGNYLVYLFSEDMERVYLTWNQGVTEIKKDHGIKRAREILRDNAEQIFERLAQESLEGFHFNTINLKTLSQDGQLYELGTVVYKEYVRGEIPDDSKLEQDLASLIKEYENYVQREIKAPVQNGTNKNNTGSELQKLIEELHNRIKVEGFFYPYEDFAAFCLSLKAKPFVLLAGVSGTGKTRLVELIARQFGVDEVTIAVRPDWNDSSDLLGYTDLNENFRPGPLLEVLHDANTKLDRPYFICLDEMNLARVKEIISRPHHRLVEEEVFRPLHQVKRGGGQTRKWLQRHPQVLQKEANPKIPEYRKKVDYDTVENRFVKYVLQRILTRVNTLYCRVSEIDSSIKAKELLKVLRGISSRVKKLTAMEFMKQVGDFYGNSGFSLVLQFAPGYREVFRNYIALLKGLNIQGRVFKVGLKSLPELYEYWCFLRLREILSDHCEITSDEIIKVNQEGVVLKLEKGVAARTIFNDINGGEVILGYNVRPEIKSPTTAQKPDVLLTIDRKMPGGHHRYILDAKYRIETEKNYQNKFGGIGPKEEDINTMHRYRDAFFWGRTDSGYYTHDVLGACILFPWKKEFRHHQFYTSLSKVGIGALPFLPGQTDLVEQFLSELLSWPDVKHAQQAILPRGHDVFWGRRYHNEPVLIGTLGSKDREKRLAFAKENGYYHIPVASISSKRLGFEYVAFFVNGKIDYYAQVEKITVKREKELDNITNLRTLKSPGGEKLYYQVVLKSGTWHKLLHSITNPGRRRVNLEDTTLEALLTARTIDELKLKREIERRLLEAVRMEELDYRVNAPDEQSWELILVESHGVIKRQLTVDGVEVWPQGATRPQKIPGHMVRQKPDYVLRIARTSGKKTTNSDK